MLPILQFIDLPPLSVIVKSFGTLITVAALFWGAAVMFSDGAVTDKRAVRNIRFFALLGMALLVTEYFGYVECFELWIISLAK